MLRVFFFIRLFLVACTPTRRSNARKQTASLSFHCRPANVKLQHGSICFSLMFSRSWMNLHSSTGNASQAEAWLPATRILTLFWEDSSFFCAIFQRRLRVYHENEPQERRSDPAADVTAPPSQRGRIQCKTAPTWRRNPKRPQGLDGKRRTVNFMNWRKCCLYRRPSPPSWIKPPSYDWPPVTWRWGSFSLRVSN